MQPALERKPSLTARFTGLIAHELGSGALVSSLAAGSLLYILEMIIVISFAALIFSGPLAGQLYNALGFLIVGDAILVAVLALLSSYPGSINVQQDTTVTILAVAASGIAAAMATAGGTQQFATIAVMIVASTLVTGLVLMLLGIFKLGGLVRFLPFPVLGGFLAGTGWLLLTGGIGMMVNGPLNLELFQSGLLLRWLPGVALGLVMLLASSRVRNALLLPGLFAAGIVVFYLVAALTGTSYETLNAGGWLIGPFPSASLWRFPLAPDVLAQVDVPALVGQIHNLIPLPLISVIALLLNANALELIVKKDVDLNRELIAGGVSNLLGGLNGSMAGFHTISFSVLNHTMTGGRRLPALFAALLIGATAFVGAGILGSIPRMALGALLVYVGAELLVAWVYQTWRDFTRLDFTIVVLIMVIVVARGFLEGIAVGLVLTTILFAVNYSRISVIKSALSGAEYHSRVTRKLDEQAVLQAHGDALYILELRGLIFFGTANNLFQRVRERDHRHDLKPIRFLVLDFSRVNGVDSTGLLSFKRMLQWAEERHIVLVLTGLSVQARDQFTRGGFQEQPGALHFFPDLDRGVEWCENEIMAADPTAREIGLSLTDQLQAIVPAAQHVENLVAQMERREMAAGDYLIRQGDEPDLIFFVESGQVTAKLETPGKAPVRLETVRGGRTVGELGFYLGTKRTASVVVDEPSVIYSLSREALAQLEQTDGEAANAFHRIIIHLLGERVVHLIRSVDALRQ